MDAAATDLSRCSECGAVWHDGITCQDHFHQMLFWEAEDPRLGEVHHLMVLCYHIQHPSLYSPQGLTGAITMLRDFLGGVRPADMRKRLASTVSSSVRTYKIKGTPNSHGSFPHPVAWTMTAADVVAQGMERYRESVRFWAQSVASALHQK